MHTRGNGRVVVTGPPRAGKSTWVNRHARAGDLRFDWDDVAATLGYVNTPLTAMRKGRLPWPLKQLVLAMRETFVDTVAQLAPSQLGECRVFLIVTDRATAEVLADAMHADLMVINERHEVVHIRHAEVLLD